MNWMLHFIHDDAGYRSWLPPASGWFRDKYVFKSATWLSEASPGDLLWSTISRLLPGAKTSTDGQYSKICGDRDELEAHAHYLGGSPQACPLCL